MPTKPKTPQPSTPKEPQARDDFQTPDYATDLIIPYLKPFERVWEPAAGQGWMVNRLREFVPCVMATSIEYGDDFLDPHPEFERYSQAIVTNPPFSLKIKFMQRCMEIGKPWALLVPVDMAMWNLEAVRNGAQWLVPTRRIDYITPTGKSGKESAAQFHSGWLTWGMNLPSTMTIVDLSIETKRGGDL